MGRDVFAGLNRSQREAAETVRGPVCILAGAGSGKTTTITRRIANQVATGAFAPTQILAVTFTDRAANEMRERLAQLGVAGVRARTFHAAALGQLRYFRPHAVGEILASKSLLLTAIGRRLPTPYRFRPVADLATEIEWAKNRRLRPETYRDGLEGHEPPIPADLVLRVFAEYERRKVERGLVDFEDVLELAVRLFDEDGGAVSVFCERYRAFTVDEYQDVNLLQQSLLERWLGGRDDLCVVGDDYQSIYSFTGATPRHLLGLPRRFPTAKIVALEENYRSTPQVLEAANRLVPRLGGSRKVLRAVRPDGPAPMLRAFRGRDAEAAFVVEEVRALAAAGVPYDEIAILYRVNASSDDYEEALARARLPFQVRGGAFLSRPAARATFRLLRGAGAEPARRAVERAVRRQGYVARAPTGVGEEEATRQADLARLFALVEEFTGNVGEFLRDVEARFGAESSGRGVNLMTYHRAKGLEFEAVFLPRLEEGEMPYKRSKTAEALTEERRLLYVGVTRAKTRLYLTWTATGKPSRFLAELAASADVPRTPDRVGLEGDASVRFAALREWRLERARADAVPPYVVFADRTLSEIARVAPTTLRGLAEISGVGPAKLERYGADVLAVVAREDVCAGVDSGAREPRGDDPPLARRGKGGGPPLSRAV